MGGNRYATGVRILLTLGTSTGGVGTHVRALARDLAQRHTVAVLAPRSTIEHFALRELPGVTAITCEISTQFHPRDLASVREIRSRIHHFRPDVVHAHGFRAALLTLLARGRRGVPVITSWHNQASGTGAKRHLEHRVEAFIAKRADLTLGASTDLAERAREVGGTNVEFSPVAAPTPVPVTDAERTRVRADLLRGSPPEALLGLLVGRVAPQKNYELLIEIAGCLPNLPVRFVVAGAADPAVLQRLQQTLRSVDPAPRIDFLGPRDDVSALMAAADFYLLTSHWEARALVVQEALLAGLPVVASRVGGIPELVSDAGILIDPAAADAAAAFAGAIVDLTDPQIRGVWAERALRRGQELPDERAVADAVEQYYLRLTRPGGEKR